MTTPFSMPVVVAAQHCRSHVADLHIEKLAKAVRSVVCAASDVAVTAEQR